jgi:hypothetical protein
MHKLKLFLLTAAAALLAACSGGSEDTLSGGNNGPGGQPAPTVASLTLLTSSPQIPSDGTADATITALVRDNNNNVMQNVPVIFTASSGSLIVSQPATTDANGILTARLTTAGDPTNRTITVNGTTGQAQSSVSVNVIGTSLTITGPSSLPLGATGTYNVLLSSAGGTGIGNQSVTITSARANGISQTPLLTDTQGNASFSLSATNSGNDTITASALGIDATVTVAVSSDAFTFTAPAANTEVTLGSNAVVTVNWRQSNVGVANSPITFATTRGTLSAGTVNTDASGNASVTISANNAGPAVVTATNSAGTSTQLTIEFVATTPATLELQASPFTVATNEQSTITAIVRDANGNLVKNRDVSFVLTDTTGGSLSVAQARTNSQGRAQTFYNASTTTSAVDGVQVDASVVGFPAVADSVNLTVAQREVFISIGTGNSIEEPNTAQYRKEWAIQVTDAQGNGVDLVDVTVSVLSERYWEGRRAWLDPPGSWATRPGAEAQPLAGCVDEDINTRNGVLDPGEDLNGNNRIEAGNRVTVAAQGGGGSTVRTDANGFALVDIFYPQDHAYWLEVTIEARTAVQGTEFAESTTFVLEGLASDFSNEDVAPPGVASPFGTDGNCGTPPPPDGP